tara:strand:+ start:2192 stop:2665 length:474 start_codon:yes stop_codon:yes gene_type:complete
VARENDINKAPNDFFKNLKNTKTIRYNSVIQIQIKSLSEKKITQAMEFEVSQFPEESQMNSQHTMYLGSFQTWLHDINFWKEASVFDAFELFMRVARHNTYYFKKFYNENPDQNSSQQAKNDCFSLYQLTTLWFSWHAFRDKGIRKTMGIKKGLFDF